RWYINRLFYRVLLSPYIAFTGWAFTAIESKTIDGANTFLSNYTQKLVNWFRRTHTGNLNLNVFGMAIGLIMMIMILIRMALGG
ncbi:MAG: hypothetical protein GTN80_11675, partial [Nitrososphaeria archaeon]|nr:hypothetical protein [Nitrososphaeria archaeon]